MMQIEEEKVQPNEGAIIVTGSRTIIEFHDHSNPNTQRYNARETKIKKSKDFAGQDKVK